MTEPGSSEITSQILIQIRDEMRSMRASFERRFDALESRMEAYETRMDRMESRMDRMESRMDRMESRMDAMEARMESLENRFAIAEDRNEERFRELLRRFGQMDADLKKFASVTQTAILHYADEMDKVRDRLTAIEEYRETTHAHD